ncbi:LacI family transcriptional regulator [Scopulibacillus darangshiensis]|uniref:LacI family transcriptional regulator n=1 Tax=Scopulibacillus darangshiensis TaxID=442528 RepID=A0A4R2NJ00_9BACL|nr:substrate-binding domain-containing protein [Scopulibacillus darangshiensis]TCP21282.1 LacI family transcriptional regulator [Scopulibacillus darangshiensis]
MKKITISDVARHANVSKSTVSQFLNKRYDYMSERTKRKIEATIGELNYQPNFVARSLKQKSTFTIGVVVANILHTFSTHFTRAIEDIFHKHDFQIIVCNADDEPQKERKYIEMLRAKQVDGIIIFPTGGNIDLYEQMKRDHFPIVFMDRIIEELEIETVLLDNHLASQMAVDQFIENGYNRIAIVTTSIIRHITPRVERIEGYRKALNSHGIEVDEAYIKTADADQMSKALTELFQLDMPPRAILAGNDIALIEVLKFMKETGKQIPEDVAVIGIDDVTFASFFTPPITTIAQPTNEMAERAAKGLLDQMKKEEGEEQLPIVERFTPSLIVRSSSL